MPEGIVASVVAKAGGTIVAKIMIRAAQYLKEEVNSAWEERASRIKDVFEAYLSRMFQKHGEFHSFVFPTNGRRLVDYYEPLLIVPDNGGLKKSTAGKLLVKGFPEDLFIYSQKILIVDTAGMGKSTLLKYMFLQAINSQQKFPIFIELRNVIGVSIEEYLIKEISGSTNEFNVTLLHRLAAAGELLIFFDGFDEVMSSEKAKIASEVTNFILNYPQSWCVLSSREEPGLNNLFGFRRFRILPLDTAQSHSLINRLAENKEQASALIDKLQSAKESGLKDFVKSPLLVSLLVRSFAFSPILPLRLSEFYRQVFDALYQTHDAKKELGGYVRDKECRLPMDSFHRVLRSLGVITYKSGQVSFIKDELISYIDQAKTLAGVSDFSSSSFLNDIQKSVPLFCEESGQIRWAHKSIQEYFSAAFICVDAKEKQAEFLRQLINRKDLFNDKNLLALCCDIDPKSFVRVVLKDTLTFVVNKSNYLYKDDVYSEINDGVKNDRVGNMAFKATRLIVLSRVKNWSDEVSALFGSSTAGLTSSDLRLLWPVGANGELAGNSGKPGMKTKIVLEIMLNQGFIPIDIASERLGLDRLKKRTGRASVASVKKISINLPKDKIIDIDDAPDNPLNQFAIFSLVNDILKSFPLAFVNVDEANNYLKQIAADEAKESSFNLSF